MCAFVLYFRVKRLESVEQDLDVFHNRLAEVAVELGGTFYLPYHKCYSRDLLQRAYPQITEFEQKKEQYDPTGVLSNECFEAYQSRSRESTDLAPSSTNKVRLFREPMSREEFMDWLPRSNDPTLERRKDSYRTLLRNATLRKQFSEEILVKPC